MRLAILLFSLSACKPATVKLDDTGVVDTASTDSGDSATDSDSGADTDSGVDTGADTDSGTDTGADTDTGEAPAIEGFTLTLDPDVVTMIHAAWTDAGATEAWVEYRWEDDTWLIAPDITLSSAVILGIPEETLVEARAAEIVDGVTRYSASAEITTGSLPSDLLVPTISSYDTDLAYDANYLMISIASGDYTYEPPFWIEIFDRSGRVVWYKKVPSNLMTFYPTPALDGTHIWYEGENIFGFASDTPNITRQTLDGRYKESWDVPNLGQAAGEGPDGSFFFEQRGSGVYGLGKLDASGDLTTVWDCANWMRTYGLSSYYCYMNTTNWSESHNSVIASMFESNTAFEIDLDSGEPIRQMGQITKGDPYSFSPSDSMFSYQHNVYWTDDDTLLVSTHVSGRSGVQMAAEYSVDDDTQTLTRIWYYQSTDLWATQVGEAIRLPNGNTFQGYGQDGAGREVTPEGTVVWQAIWPRDKEGDRVIGHTSFIEDLYALNVGP